MASQEEPFLLEQFDRLLNDDFAETSWSEFIQQELNGSSNLDRENGAENSDYNFLSVKHAKEILRSYGAAMEAADNPEPLLIQCTNCDAVFAGKYFELHVCTHNADKTPILPTYVREDNEESEFDRLCRSNFTQLRKNGDEIRRLIRGRSFPVPDDDAIVSEIGRKDGQARQSNHECFVCNRKFVHESGLYRHYDKHIGEMLPLSKSETSRLHSIFLCVFCGEAFTTEQKLWNHFMRNHLQLDGYGPVVKFLSKELQYEINGLKMEPKDPEMNGLDVSIAAKAEGEDDNEQRQVMRISKTDLKVNEFMRHIHVLKVFQCEHCDSVFTDKKSLMQHTSKHNPLSLYSCQSCELDALSLKDLLLHRHYDCVSFHDFRDTLKDIPRVWVCNVCEDEVLGLEQLILHRQQSFHFFPLMHQFKNELVFSCDFCSSSYDNANSLVAHLKERHLKRPRMTIVPETSSRIQKSPSATRKGGGHQTSTRPRAYLCEICGKSYTQSSHLWQHLRFHQGVKPFVCPVEECGRRFTIRPDLNDHIRKCHTGERPYECTICGKRFLTGSVYYQHRLIHRGERRYGCEECGKRFYRADALKNHMRIHSGEKPYKCWVDGCTKTFRQRGDRDKHVKARHKNAPPMPSPKRKKVVSFGLGRTKNNKNLYSARPERMSNDPDPGSSVARHE